MADRHQLQIRAVKQYKRVTCDASDFLLCDFQVRPKNNAIEDASAQGASKRWKSLSPGGSSMWNNAPDVRENPSVFVVTAIGLFAT